MPRPRLLAVLLALLALAPAAALAGCGGDDGGDGGGESSAEKGSGTKGKGFTLDVPKGWKDETKNADKLGFAGFTPDVVLVGEFDEGFRPSVNVVRETSLSDDVSLEDYVEAGRAVLDRGSVGEEQIPGEEVQLGDVSETELGGEQAAVFDHTRNVQDKRLRARQVIALRDGTAYTLTYTALADRFDDDLPQLEQVLESWEWQ